MSTVTREAGQSQASADALAALSAANVEASFARMEVARLNRQLREARKALKVMEAAEAAAERAYYATPYAE